MESKTIEIYSEASNHGIVRMPGRRFPGCVIQGDSLSILVNLAENVCERLPSTSDEDLIGEAEELRDLLLSRLKHYESVLNSHGIDLPYSSDAR